MFGNELPAEHFLKS